MFELIALLGLVFVGFFVFAILGGIFWLLKIALKVLLLPLALVFGLLKVVLCVVFGVVALVLAPVAFVILLCLAIPFLLLAGLVGLGFAVAT